ncbi:UNVERIFIED_CONTAM: hypothetical protein ABIE34_002749 [Jeotgalibacillus campisalis]
MYDMTGQALMMPSFEVPRGPGWRRIEDIPASGRASFSGHECRIDGVNTTQPEEKRP